ncbi:hypothetical protein WMF30_10920 [Sorangium sp. So ce134]
MSAIGDASEALLALQAVLRRGYDARALPGAADALAALDRLAEAGVMRTGLLVLAYSLRHSEVAPVEVADALEELSELAADEVIAAASAAAAAVSRPETPPPPSGRGDEEAVEHRAARAATGDTLPPESGDVPLGWMACAGADTLPPLEEAYGAATEPPAPESVEWWDDQPAVRS